MDPALTFPDSDPGDLSGPGCLVFPDGDVLADEDLGWFVRTAGAGVVRRAGRVVAARAIRITTSTGRALWLPDVLRTTGVPVVTVNGWESRGRPALTPNWQVFHHTASNRKSGNAPALRICTDGRHDLPGPLCNVLVARDGTFYVVASGVANHAGEGRYPDGSTGNALSVGWECENDGLGEPWRAAQLEAIALGMAAVANHLGHNVDRIIGHKEFAPGRKPDPAGINMSGWRQRVATVLEDEVTDTDIEKIVAALRPVITAEVTKAVEATTVPVVTQRQNIRNVKRIGRHLAVPDIEG